MPHEAWWWKNLFRMLQHQYRHRHSHLYLLCICSFIMTSKPFTTSFKFKKKHTERAIQCIADSYWFWLTPSRRVTYFTQKTYTKIHTKHDYVSSHFAYCFVWMFVIRLSVNLLSTMFRSCLSSLHPFSLRSWWHKSA